MKPIPWEGGAAFEKIGFAPKGSVRYQYAVTAGAEGIVNSFAATATGDLDENGKVCVFTVAKGSAVYPKAVRTGDEF